MAGVLLLAGGARAQSTAGYGDWQLHLPTNRPLRLADAGDRIYVSTGPSFYYLDKKLNTTQTLSSRDGLSDVEVVALAHDSVTRQTVVAYRNGNVDVLRADGRVRNLSDILRKPIQGGKDIYQVSIANGKAYLSARFGLVVLDLAKLEVSDTYSNIGPGGTAVAVYDATVANGAVFAATSAGLLRGALSTNLLDYRNWTLFLPAPLNPNPAIRIYPFVTSYAGQVYAAVEGTGSAVYRYVAGSPARWDQVPNTYTFQFRNLRSTSTGVLIVDDLSGVRRIDRANAVTPVIPGPVGEQTMDAVRSVPDGAYYVAYYNRGLERVRPGTGQANERFAANGPENNLAFSVLADARTSIVNVFTGGYSERYAPAGRREGFHEYAAGQWTTLKPPGLPGSNNSGQLLGPVRGARTPDGTLYVGANGGGLLEWKGPGQVRHFGENLPAGSPLLGTFGGGNNRVEITDLAADAEGNVYVVNRHLMPNTSGLFILNPTTAAWRTIPWVSGLEALERIVLGDDGTVWVSVSRKTDPTGAALGIFAVNPAAGTPNAPRFFTSASGLPDNQIYELAKDRRGYIWAATIKGVAVFNDPSGPFSPDARFTTPRVTKGEGAGFEVLFSEAVRTVAVDGGDRKWFGTDNGLWLFSPDADEALLHFTTANSPLPSNRIVDVKVNDKTGDVWVATDAGVVAYRGAATVTEGDPRCTAVFPNPVRPEFTGTVGINGLANNALVKITDVAGHLVYAAKANGGTVTWNLTTPDGQRVRSGIYLVLSADADGKNSCVSKVAVLSK